MFSRASDFVPRGLGWVGNLGAIWLACAFVAGALVATTTRSAVAAGSCTLAIATFVHYWSLRVAMDGLGADLLRFPVPQWLLVGIVLGGAFGALGRAWRTGRGQVAVASVMGAVFGAEALYLIVAASPNALRLAVPLELVCLLVLPVLLVASARRRLASLAGALALAPPVAVAIAITLLVARRVY